MLLVKFLTSIKESSRKKVEVVEIEVTVPNLYHFY